MRPVQRHASLRDALAQKVAIELRRLKVKQHEERLSMLERHHADQQKLSQAVYTKRKDLLTTQGEAAVKLAEEHRKEFMTVYGRHNKEIQERFVLYVCDSCASYVFSAQCALCIVYGALLCVCVCVYSVCNVCMRSMVMVVCAHRVFGARLYVSCVLL
jgi:hypothetical protein